MKKSHFANLLIASGVLAPILASNKKGGRAVVDRGMLDLRGFPEIKIKFSIMRLWHIEIL